MKKQHNNRPLISVIMPAYNAEGYVAQAIESVLAQTYTKFELIVVDDASQDSTWSIIKDYKTRFPRKITAIRLKKNRNRGGDEAGNVAFSKAKGEFIARMDADDVAHPQRLEKQLNFLLLNPTITLVGSNASIINRDGEEIGEKLMPTKHQDIYREYFTFHPLIHPTLMIRRSALHGAKQLYRIELPSNNDYHTFFSMINEGHRYANLPEKLLQYRMHGKNDSLSHVKKTFKNTMQTRQLMIQRYGYQPTLLAMIKSNLQATIVAMLPQPVVFGLYLLIRRIYTPMQFVEKIAHRFQGKLDSLIALAQ